MDTNQNDVTNPIPEFLRKMARIAIAKDVLLRLKHLNIQSGSYVGGNIWIGKETDNAKKHLSQLTKKCTVCALGACFFSHINLFNGVKMGDINGRFEKTTKPLISYFDETQIMMIESAFEQINMSDNYSFDLRNCDVSQAIIFGKCYKTDKLRLQAIMRNIIKNNGTFKP